MSITKSYNKLTGIYYAYETTYEWSDEKQKKVQRKRCIGQFDPKTGEVIPNGKVGRPSISAQTGKHPDTATSRTEPHTIKMDSSDIAARLAILEEKARILSEEIHELMTDVNSSSDSKG